MFAIKLGNPLTIENRCEEGDELCDWMELAHAPGRRVMEERLVENIGARCYDAWIRARRWDRCTWESAVGTT